MFRKLQTSLKECGIPRGKIYGHQHEYDSICKVKKKKIEGDNHKTESNYSNKNYNPRSNIQFSDTDPLTKEETGSEEGPCNIMTNIHGNGFLRPFPRGPAAIYWVTRERRIFKHFEDCWIQGSS